MLNALEPMVSTLSGMVIFVRPGHCLLNYAFSDALIIAARGAFYKGGLEKFGETGWIPRKEGGKSGGPVRPRLMGAYSRIYTMQSRRPKLMQS